jgi:hypothetical protein
LKHHAGGHSLYQNQQLTLIMKSSICTKGISLLFSALFLLFFFPACKKDHAEEKPNVSDDQILRIPVVVHVLYATDEFNISDAKIQSQIAVLNQDFRKRNTNQGQAPAEFASLIADVGIEFYLATKDPAGQPTTGITRTQSTLQGFDGRPPGGGSAPVESLSLYFTSKGGHDAWPTDRYLNIWVAEMSNRQGKLALAGYAQLPDTKPDPRIDGVVIDPRAFGTIAPVEAPHEYGRTATHEIGHWLNLYHTYGSGTNQCQNTDYVEDTPAAFGPHYGNPTHPLVECGGNVMFMNFMDYADDAVLCMFTKGQRNRMRATLAPGGWRQRLYEHIAQR